MSASNLNAMSAGLKRKEKRELERNCDLDLSDLFYWEVSLTIGGRLELDDL